MLAVLFIGGCAQDAKQTTLTLYSINGGKDVDRAKAKETGEQFHGFGVLGKADILDGGKRQELAQALEAGLAQKDVKPADCFWPRHGLRVVEGGKTTDYLICFQCNQVYIYQGGGEKHQMKTIPSTTQAIFDKHLRAAGLPLAP